MTDLLRRLRRRSDPAETPAADPTPEHLQRSAPPEGPGIGPPTPGRRKAGGPTPKLSPEPVLSYRNGVPFREGDPRFPDVWGHRSGTGGPFTRRLG
jgi:hypothetical protein